MRAGILDIQADIIRDMKLKLFVIRVYIQES